MKIKFNEVYSGNNLISIKENQEKLQIKIPEA